MQNGFASHGFLVVRGNSWGFLWSGRHARRWKGVRVCKDSLQSLTAQKGQVAMEPCSSVAQ